MEEDNEETVAAIGSVWLYWRRNRLPPTAASPSFGLATLDGSTPGCCSCCTGTLLRSSSSDPAGCTYLLLWQTDGYMVLCSFTSGRKGRERIARWQRNSEMTEKRSDIRLQTWAGRPWPIHPTWPIESETISVGPVSFLGWISTAAFTSDAKAYGWAPAHVRTENTLIYVHFSFLFQGIPCN